MHRMLAGAALALGLAATPAAAITLGQVDSFENGTTQNWFAGGGPFGAVPPVPPQLVATGGPAGAGDGFLQLTAQGGNGPGSRLVAMNAVQWSGSYAGAGIAAIAMDLINLGTSDLTIRLLLEDPALGPPLNIAVTTAAAVLPAGSGWTSVVLPLDAASLAALQGSPAALLGNVTLLRLIHSPGADGPDPVAGMLGIDNITALATTVPEPLSLALLAPGLLGLAAARRYRGAMRNAPSSRIVSPFSIRLATMCSASAAYSSGAPSRGG